MKIEIMGYSGSGKSTLCRKLAQMYHVPALHLDTVQFLPNWAVRADEDKQEMVHSFLDRHPNGWVIDGNYTKLSYERRIDEADIIIQLLFGRISCLWRCFKRFLTYKGKSRPDMAAGCNEKMDWEFIQWILWKGRSKTARERYRNIQSKYPGKVVVIKNQRQLDDFLKNLNP